MLVEVLSGVSVFVLLAHLTKLVTGIIVLSAIVALDKFQIRKNMKELKKKNVAEVDDD